MVPYAVDKIKHALNTDVIRRLLIRYFISKGFTESFDRVMYPSIIQDIAAINPILLTKVEVVPHVIEMDPLAGKAILGWNLFVLGTHRMYLGETHHRDLAELARQITSGMIQQSGNAQLEGWANDIARHQVTPRQVIVFMTRVLGKHESGYVDLIPPKNWATTQLGYGTGVGRSSFYAGSSANYGSTNL